MAVWVGLREYVDIYAVLFVAEVETRIADEWCFERLGVGRMIETRFAGGFQDLLTKDQNFWLV